MEERRNLRKIEHEGKPGQCVVRGVSLGLFSCQTSWLCACVCMWTPSICFLQETLWHAQTYTLRNSLFPAKQRRRLTFQSWLPFSRAEGPSSEFSWHDFCLTCALSKQTALFLSCTHYMVPEGKHSVWGLLCTSGLQLTGVCVHTDKPAGPHSLRPYFFVNNWQSYL